MVLAVAMVGIGTFFLPLITTGTPIFGRTRWSLFDIASRISAGELPPLRRAADPVGMYLGLIITLLPIYGIWLYSGTAALLSVDSLRRKLSLVGLVGMLISVADWHWDRHEFEDVFFGGWAYSNSGLTRHVAFGDLIVVMIALMAVLTYIARGADTEGQPTSRNVEDKVPRGNREPEVLAAEILPPKEDESGRHPEDRRFRD